MTNYTASQQDAINELDHTLQLIACAGSGKTQVISQRISQILGQPGVTPGNVVAFTFTEKAAGELKDRIQRIVGAEHPAITGMAEMFVGTMHGFALNLLQTYVPETFKFSALTDVQQRLLVDRESRRSGLTSCPLIAGGALSRYKDSKTYMQALSMLQEDMPDFSKVPDGVVESLQSYLRLLTEKRYFDFTGMIATAVDYLESKEDDEDAATQALLRHVRDQVKYVVVDEYQDVNPLQERLIAGLVRFGANLCVVGDDDQTIYQWRGSEVRNILRFAERHDDVRTIALNENFRSSQGIVALGRAVAESIPAGERLPKGMEYASHQAWERGDLLALSFKSADDEAAWIADRILELRGVPFRDDPDSPERGLSWSDCAVLYRSVKDADPLVAEFRRRGIPFLVKGLARLFEYPEIAAISGMFRYLVGDIDELTLRALFQDANLVVAKASLARLVKLLDASKRFDQGERWGTYNIQRLYLDALESLELREDTIPGESARAELVMYILGKFSQVISDFEAIYFQSPPEQKYRDFVGFLTFQAPSYYEESDEDSSYATPDAVTISTVHRAKGMQWPAVFVPCMRANRFPSQRWGGRGVFHVIPPEAIENADRYRGTLSEETRLYYVAVTRAKKYLAVSYSPGAGRNFKRPSAFFTNTTASVWVSTSPTPIVGPRLDPHPRIEIPPVTISFSELKYLFDCPYQFKLRFMYGFNPPIHEALGYGKGLHDALAEMHKRALQGDVPDVSEAESLVDRHLHTPYAYPALHAELRSAAIEAIQRYFKFHGSDLERTEHSEKQITVQVAPGVTIDGRIDLIRRLATDEIAIVDFKSTDRAQDEDVTRDQLHVYALGYQELTGQSADLIEVLNLDAAGKNTREVVTSSLLDEVRERIVPLADDVRANRFECTHDHSKDSGFDDLAWLVGGGKPKP